MCPSIEAMICSGIQLTALQMTCTLSSGCMAGENMDMGHGKSVRAYIQALPSEQSSPSPNQPRKASRASEAKAKGGITISQCKRRIVLWDWHIEGLCHSVTNFGS